MVSNAHDFLKQLIEPITKSCKYAMVSPKDMKEKFLPDSKKFYQN